jgi:hypothetical protein
MNKLNSERFATGFIKMKIVFKIVRGPSGKYPTILNIAKAGRMALM